MQPLISQRPLRRKRLRQSSVPKRRLLAELLEPRTMLTTYFVNSLEDGRFNAFADGELTLREAITAANADQAVGDAAAGTSVDIIRFEASLFESLPLGDSAEITMDAELGQFNLEGNVFLLGPGSDKLTINAGGEVHRIFSTDPGSVVTISGLDLAGGGFGGIVSRGDLTLVDSVVRDSVTILDAGGGITNFGPRLTIESSVIRDNRSSGNGGGLASFGGEVRVSNSTIFGNAALGDGGGVYLDNGQSNGSLDAEFTNVTISTNVADGDGGGIAFDGLNLDIFHGTITGNSSDFDGNGDGDGGGVHSRPGLFMTSTIVAGNFRGSVETEVPNDLGGLLDPEASQANLIGDPNSASILFDRTDPDFGFRTGSILGDGNGGVLPIDDILDPVIRNTQGLPVHTLGIDSVAIDQGLPTYEPLIAVDGAQLHYRFDERDLGIEVDPSIADFRIADSTPIGGSDDAFLEGAPNLEIAGPTPALGSAIEFDGIDDRIITNQTELDDFSISMWVKPNSTGAFGTDWFEGDSLIDNFGDDGFGLSILGVNFAFGVGSKSDPSQNATIRSDSIAVDGKWHHLVATRDGSTGRMIMYIDGTIHRFLDGPLGPRSTRGLTLGNRLGTAAFYRGGMDEVAIFDKVLTASQVRQQFVSASLPVNDQRGYPFRRAVFEETPFDLRFGAPDIGAFERQPASQFTPNVFEVSTLDDESDGNFTFGDLSLREAIELANRSPDHDRIIFSENLPRQVSLFLPNDTFPRLIELEFGAIPIEFDLTIEGLGSSATAISQLTPNSSHFEISEVAMANISGLRLTGASDSAILNFGHLTLDDMNIRENDGFQGGAVLNFGQLEISNSSLSSNLVEDAGGAIYNSPDAFTGMTPSVNISGGVLSGNGAGASGGAIFNIGNVELDQVVVSSNTAGEFGGGIENLRGSLTIRQSQIIDNTADSSGGGIESRDALEISGSTIAGNTATNGSGGGIVLSNQFAEDNTSVMIRNNTFNNNRAGDNGGGIDVNRGSGAQIVIRNNTIWENSAGSGGGVEVSDDGSVGRVTIDFNTIAENNAIAGGGILTSGELFLQSNIIANNSGIFDLSVSNSGSLFLATRNIIGSTNQSGLTGFNQVGVDPMLDDSLADNGGPTPTVKLLAGSPAIDASFSNTRLVDQRGFPVIDQEGIGGSGNGASDIGAYEIEPLQIDFYESSTASFNSAGQQTSNTVSQFVEGDQQVQFGLGYTDGRSNSQIPSEPGFLGFKFDPDPYSFGGIGEGLFGDRYGAEVTLDFGGRAGIEYGYYLDAGSVGVDYDSMFRSLMSETTPGSFEIQTASFVEDGSLFTVSPRVGAYADLVFELDASISGVGCFIACTSPFRLPINLKESVSLFSINGQEGNAADGAPILDGEIKFGAGSLSEILADEAGSFLDELSANREARRMAEMEMAQAEQDLRRDPDDADARSRRDQAMNDVERADSEEQKKSKKKDSDGIDLCVGTFVTACVGAASGGLLGVEATLGVGAAAGPVNVSKPIGSIELTVPEIALSDTKVNDAAGTLSATTEDFESGSREDDDRRIAKLSVDVAGVLGPLLGIPAGRYEASLGDVLSVSLQTLSYDVQPRLAATQDVQVVPFFHSNQELQSLPVEDRRGSKLDFNTPVNVSINGTNIAENGVTEFWFQPGSTLTVTPVNAAATVEVTPQVRLGHRFSNDIGLDIDVKGILEALAINVEVFGSTIVDIGPLIRYEHEIGNFDLGSVFRTDTPLSLSTSTDTLTPFTLGQPINVVMDGMSPGGALPLDLGDGSFGAPESLLENSNDTLFLSFPTTLMPEASSSQAKSLESLEFSVSGASPEIFLVVAQPGITLVEGSGPDAVRTMLKPDVGELLTSSQWSLEGFDPKFGDGQSFIGIRDLSDVATTVSSRGNFRASDFEAGELIDAARLDAVNNDGLENGEVVNPFLIDGARPGTFAPLDIDQNGEVSIQHDLVLVQQFINGIDPSAAFVGEGATLTTDEQLLARLQALQADGTLDADDSGGAPDATDAALISMVFFGQGDNDMDPQDQTAVESLIRSLRGRNISTGINNQSERAARLAAEQGLQMTRTAGDDFLGIRSTNEAVGRVSAFEIDEDAVLGSSPWIPYELIPAGDFPAAELANYRSPVQIEDIVIAAAPGMPSMAEMPGAMVAASSAAGTPPRLMPAVEAMAELARTRDEDMIDQVPIAGMDTRETSRMTRSASLGEDADAPLFFRLPDAGGWDIQLADGVLISDVVFDTNVGGNQYLNHDPRLDGSNVDFDIVIPETGQRVEFSMDSGDDGYARLSDLGIGGFSRFILYPRSLPSATLQRIDNLERPEIDLIVGLVMDDSQAIVPGEPPILIAEPLYAREDILTPNAVVAEPDTATEFEIKRNDIDLDVNDAFGTRVELTVNGQEQEFTFGDDNQLISNAFPANVFPASSFAKIEFLGSNLNDSLIIGSSDLPFFVPIEFDAGEGTADFLITGAGDVTLDLANQISIRNVEFIALGAIGNDTLKLDAQAVYDNDPSRRSLIILGSQGDQIHVLGDGWNRREDREDVGFGSFDVWEYNDGKNPHLAGVQLFVRPGVST